MMSTMQHRSRLLWIAIGSAVAVAACTAPSQGSDTAIAQPAPAASAVSAATA